MITFNCKHLHSLFAIAILGFASPVSAIDLLELPAVQSGSASRALLLDVDARSDKAFVAVGQYGVIIASGDDGANWTQATVPASVMLTGVHFPTPDMGWAVGHDGLILNSADGGQTWQKQLDGHQLNEQIIAVAEITVEKVKGELELLQSDETTDEYAIEDAVFMLEEAEFMLEGATDDVEAGPVRPLLDVWFRNEREGFVVGSYGMLLHTTNGGQDWKLVSNRMNNPEALHLNQIVPAPDGYLYIAGEAGYVYRSTDGGDSWDSLEPGYDGSFYGVAVVPDGDTDYELLAYGMRGNLFQSADKGDSWEKLDSGTSVTLMNGITLRDGTVFLAGQGGAILTRAPGQQSFSRAKNPDRRPILGLEQLAGGNVLIAGWGGVHKTDPAGAPIINNTEDQ